jgi:hypothetical protein
VTNTIDARHARKVLVEQQTVVDRLGDLDEGLVGVAGLVDGRIETALLDRPANCQTID